MGGAEGMEVDGDGATFEAEGFVEEGAVAMRGVPAVVERGVTHGVVSDVGVAVAIDDGGDSNLGVVERDVAEPVFADLVGAVFLGAIEIAHAPEAFFLRDDGVVDHASANFIAGSVDAGDEEGSLEVYFVGACFAFEVGVVEGAFDGEALVGEEGEFGIDGGFVLHLVRSADGFFSGFGGFAFDADGDAAEANEDADFLVGGDGFAIGTDGVGPPLVLFEAFAEGVAEGGGTPCRRRCRRWRLIPG